MLVSSNVRNFEFDFETMTEIFPEISIQLVVESGVVLFLDLVTIKFASHLVTALQVFNTHISIFIFLVWVNDLPRNLPAA